MHLDMDPALADVIEHVREVHTPIAAAIADGREVTVRDLGALFGAVTGLLKAVDARPTPPPARALQAVA